MMLDTSTYYGQPSFVPPQFLLQGIFGHPHGQQGQSFGGFPPQGLLGHQPSQYGQQPIWPSFGFAPQNPLAFLSGLYGPQQHPIWPAFGGGGLGQLAPIAPYLQGQLGQHGGPFQGGWPQFGFGIGQLAGFAPQFGALGQQYLMNALGRGILPYQGVPHMAYTGC
jgi:hypothetical protein